MAKGEVVLAQLVLECRTLRASLDQRRTRRTVDLEHAAEPREVDRDRARVAVAHARLHAPDHAGAAAVWDRRRTALSAPLEQLRHLRGVFRERDEVGHVVET